MMISFIEVKNFRKLKSTHIGFDDKMTIFVGANNSGKTSALIALRYFLLAPNKISLRDITISNWVQIDAVGAGWEDGESATGTLTEQLPSMDVWLDVPVEEIHHVVHLIPTLEWRGGQLGVRLRFEFKDQDRLRADYLRERHTATLVNVGLAADARPVRVWPACLTEFLERRLQSYISLEAYSLDPVELVRPVKGLATPQLLPPSALPLGASPFKGLIKIDEIAAQRDFADAGERADSAANRNEDAQSGNTRRFKRRLSDQLRSYYDRHIDPARTPSAEDYEALRAIQGAEENFDGRLEHGFAAAFRELEDLGYPGIASPKLKISTQLRATDGLKHGSAVQYQVVDPADDSSGPALRLPEDYSGLGYQNLIAMVFMLMSYRDEWMRVGKLGLDDSNNSSEAIEPLHLVIVEEPEAHLHAQVQQVFIKKAYTLLRAHSNLGEGTSYLTQLVVSTHSSHVAHEADFASLRYFRRRPAIRGESTTTTVANLSFVFGDQDETQRFVKRYLKATHCDLFFADGAIFVEGQAERILIPHFIRHHYEQLSRRYITLLDLGGSHAHKFRNLVDELGLTTLIVADLDACTQMKTDGKPARMRSAKPTLGTGQKTTNPVLKTWHPRLESVDDLCELSLDKHLHPATDGYELYVAYQKPTSITLPGKPTQIVIPRTFEDALILENHGATDSISGSAVSRKIKRIVAEAAGGDDLVDEIHELLKDAEKAAFAIDCLMVEDPKAIMPPTYVADGLKWLEAAIGRDLLEAEPTAAVA